MTSLLAVISTYLFSGIICNTLLWLRVIICCFKICEVLISNFSISKEKKERSFGHNWLFRKIKLTYTLINLNFGLPRIVARKRKLIMGFKVIEETLRRDSKLFPFGYSNKTWFFMPRRNLIIRTEINQYLYVKVGFSANCLMSWSLFHYQIVVLRSLCIATDSTSNAIYPLLVSFR